MTSATAPIGPAPSNVPLQQDAKVIGLVGLAHASSHFGHLLLPLMFPVFMKEFGLSYSELGLLMTTFFVVSGVGQAFPGFVVDRLGARPSLFLAVAVFALACVSASSVTGYGLLAVAALAGLGNATFHPVDFTILNQRVSGPRLGYAFSAHGLTGNLGWAAAPVFFASTSLAFGWRNAYLAAALVYLVVLAILVLQRDQLSTQVARRELRRGRRQAGARHGVHEAAGGVVVLRLLFALDHDAGSRPKLCGFHSQSPARGEPRGGYLDPDGLLHAVRRTRVC